MSEMKLLGNGQSICLNVIVRKIFTVIFVCLLFSISVKEALASGFHISSIGDVPTNGRQLSKFWHSSSKPTFRGEALPGAEVIVDIDGKALAVNADSAGDWVFTPVDSLSEGSHQVIVKSGGSEIKMELVTGSGNVDWTAVENDSGETLPTVGFILPTLTMLLGGSGAIFGAKKLRDDIKRQ
jgi:hypothetical protein